MLIRGINTGSSIDSIIAGNPDGKITNYIIADKPQKGIEKFATLAEKKSSTCNEVFIKVKFDWNLGQRARTFEVVTKKANEITIHKFVTESNFDRHILDLERVRDTLLKQTNNAHLTIKCCLIASNDKSLDKIKALTKDMDCDFEVETL